MAWTDRLFSRTGLIAAWVVLVVVQLPIREVIPPDEPRFAHQAQLMRQSGEWIVPQIGDAPNVDKPPVLFWSVAIASLPFDRVTETASRVPSAIGALVVLLLTARLGRRLWGSDAIAYGGALIALTGVEFFQKAQWCSCDMTMAAFAWTAITLWGEALFGDPVPSRPGLRIALGWAAVGFGILTKGPVALLWALFWVAAEAIARRRVRPLARIALNPGIMLMVLIVGGWLYALGERAGWDFVREATIHQNLDRFVSAWNSVQPWWFYSYQLPADFLPWAAFLPAVILLVWRSRPGEGDTRSSTATRAAALFALFGVIFFSCSSGKRGVYVMEAFPALSLLIAAAVVEDGLGTLGFVLMGVLGVALGVVAPGLIASGTIPIPAALAAAAGATGFVALVAGGLLIAAGAVAGLVFARRGRRVEALASVVAGSLLAMTIGGAVGGATWSRMQSARPFCAKMDAVVPKGERIVVHHAKVEQFRFYTLRPATEFRSDDDVVAVLAGGTCRFAIMPRVGYERVRNRPPVDKLEVVASGRINRDEWILVGPPAADGP
jgi:4-amino-4-deoxy-L-arabinose transferase-like glycosyltransferase